jgi:hypothetical protein
MSINSKSINNPSQILDNQSKSIHIEDPLSAGEKACMVNTCILVSNIEQHFTRATRPRDKLFVMW